MPSSLLGDITKHGENDRITVYLLLTDETNLAANARVKFFAYGGLIVDLASLPALDQRIAAIRADALYNPGDELKFDTHSRPGHVSIEAFTTAKNRVVQACIALDCKFIVYVVLHAIARNNQQATLVDWGANHVIGKFNYFLRLNDSYGIVVVDRLPAGAEFRFLSNKFCHGLTFPEDDPVTLDRVKLFGSTCINASHASSAMDIILGSFRYCINQPLNRPVARTMMANLTRLIWCRREGMDIYPFEKGLIFRPRNVQRADYQAEYDALLTHINSLVDETAA